VTAIRVNDTLVDVDADPLTPLQIVLHDRLGLASVRAGCSVGACGTCTVLLGGEPARACLVPVGLVGDLDIATSEAWHDDADEPIRAAFVQEHAFQCGYCVPGFVLAARALLAHDPAPLAPAIDQALSGNLCRCGSYGAIRAAVVRAAGASGGSAGGAPPRSVDPQNADDAEDERSDCQQRQ
jgi:aerobic-type carbon monoxide dehydrogenase small subunit (CoxS/CutS family)